MQLGCPKVVVQSTKQVITLNQSLRYSRVAGSANAGGKGGAPGEQWYARKAQYLQNNTMAVPRIVAITGNRVAYSEKFRTTAKDRQQKNLVLKLGPKDTCLRLQIPNFVFC